MELKHNHLSDAVPSSSSHMRCPVQQIKIKSEEDLVDCRISTYSLCTPKGWCHFLISRNFWKGMKLYFINQLVAFNEPALEVIVEEFHFLGYNAV
jgi:hypothetical protein